LKVGRMLKRSIGVVSPSFPRASRQQKGLCQSIANLEEAGYRVKLGSNATLDTGYTSGTIQERVADIHDMFEDNEVDLILAASGGWNANDLLDHLHYLHIAKHPKPFVGFSDITVLLYALHARASVPVFYGPTLISAFADTRLTAYTLNYLGLALSGKEYDVIPADKISTASSLDRVSTIKSNEGWVTVHDGQAEGILFGGNLGTLYLSCHTGDFMSFSNSDLILVLEDDNESHGAMNYRHMRMLEQLGLLKRVKGVLWGRDIGGTRYEPGYGPDWILKQFFGREVPIFTGIDFGHTLPFATIPLGRRCLISQNLIRVYNE
jgi:muramoyltetrapeptide carboxypeptidase